MYICTEDLRYTYMPGSPLAVEALRGVNLSIARGSFTVLLGPSGSGKSTLLQHFNGLLCPMGGRVLIDGEPLKYGRGELLHVRRNIGLVFQEPEKQFFSETLFDEIAFAPRNFGLGPELVEKRVSLALQQVGLGDLGLLERSPFQLSAGQQRLAAIASVLAMQPRVMILDEPTAGLDQAGQKRLFTLLKGLNRDAGFTVVVVTHRLEQAVPMADRVLVLDRGRITMEGSPEEVFMRVDELERCGLSIPPLTRLMRELAAAGLPFSTKIFSMGEACKEICDWRNKELQR
jgi:energy-coupling factor transport system ATP-binding protein